MQRLFLFCIGGTGSRVLKALTFLLATGVNIKDKQIIPIIIDPDRANGDVNRTIEIIKNYQEIHKQLDGEKNSFFKTPINSLSSLDAFDQAGNNQKISSTGFQFGIDGVNAGRFRDFINYDQLKGGNKALISALFSDKNLNADLEVGFKGNPHMGSVVLNRFTRSEDFQFFASRFNPNDRIFIVSSIFGGTGAAGFPLIVKNIREPKEGLANPEYLKNSRLGAITVTPYFGVSPDQNSDIDKGTFISKTKAALEYYAKNISGNNSLNSLYYIGDPHTTDYENNEGSSNQKNHAHMVEFLSALAVLDFIETSDSKLETHNGKAHNPIYKEYGLNGDELKTNLLNLGKLSKRRIGKPMIQYTYAVEYWRNCLKDGLGQPWAKGTAKVTLDEAFFSGEFFAQELKQFNDRYIEWLNEMAINDRGFAPFKLSVGKKLMHTLVEGIEPKKKRGLFGGKSEWDNRDFDKYLNVAEKQIADLDPVNKLMTLFSVATDNIFQERINLNIL